MPSIRQLFLQNVGQTSELPLLLEVSHAKGMYIYDRDGKRYLDLNSGISVSSLGHSHPNVVYALKDQADKYLHTMVYGEHAQGPQIKFATLLLDHIDSKYESVYYLMSGTEATELAMKIGKRATGRYEIVCCRHSYHGSTQGAESLRSDLEYSSAFFPLIPGIKHITFNEEKELQKITTETAAVIIEPVQAEAGILPPKNNYLQKIKARCEEVGALMILDEIQTGFGRTGHLFAHQKYDVLPDLILIGKAMGGGMPISAVVGSKALMNTLLKNPTLGHITTFGGHPMSCTAAHAGLKTLIDEDIVKDVSSKEKLFKTLLKHNIIKEVRSSGLMMAIELTRRKYLKHVVNHTIESGALIDYFLFNDRSFRVAPPLIIKEEQIKEGCDILLAAMDFAEGKYRK